MTTSTTETTTTTAHSASPVVAFIIGLAIILLASVLNAAGLNLTKLDHVGPASFALVLPANMHPRSARMPFPSLPVAETGCGHYGSWE